MMVVQSGLTSVTSKVFGYSMCEGLHVILRGGVMLEETTPIELERFNVG